MKAFILVFLTLSFFISFFSCGSGNNNAANTVLPGQKISKSLSSNSTYKISVWNNYSIEESIGPDFTVYYIVPGDTSKILFGTGGLYFGGHPQKIAPNEKKKLLKDSLLDGNLLGKKITWTIFDYGNTLSAETIVELGDYDKISAFAHGHSYSDIDSLISVLESLKLDK